MSHEVRSSDSRLSLVTAHLIVDGRDVEVMGTGNGPIEAFVTALNSGLGTDLDVVDYAEHALGAGKAATAVAYVETRSGDGQVRWGVGMDSNIMTASLRAVVSSFLRQRAAAAEGA
jgi:2-isopropylmalate synthase